MEVFFVRHTKPNVKPNICYGQTDVDVMDSFANEAMALKYNIPYSYWDKVYSSPLLRCRKLADFCGFEAIIDNRIQELNFGEWEMKTWLEISGMNSKAWFNDWIYEKAGGGESFYEQYLRIVDFLDELKMYDLEKILVFTHSGCIRAAMVYTNQIRMEEAFNQNIPYGSLNRFII